MFKINKPSNNPYSNPRLVAGLHILALNKRFGSAQRWHEEVMRMHTYTQAAKHKKIQSILDHYGETDPKKLSTEIDEWLQYPGGFEPEYFILLQKKRRTKPKILIPDSDNTINKGATLLTDLLFLLKQNSKLGFSIYEGKLEFGRDIFGPMTRQFEVYQLEDFLHEGKRSKLGFNDLKETGWRINITPHGMLASSSRIELGDSGLPFLRQILDLHQDSKERPFLGLRSFWSYYQVRWGAVLSLPWNFLNKHFSGRIIDLLSGISPPYFIPKLSSQEENADTPIDANWWHVLPPFQKYIFMHANPEEVSGYLLRHPEEIKHLEYWITKTRGNDDLNHGINLNELPEYITGYCTAIMPRI